MHMFIQMDHIEKAFEKRLSSGENNILNGISLSIDRGEMVAIKGPSGAGKSTLLHILGCLDKPTKGSYYLDNENVAEMSPKQLAVIRNRKIGFVLQHFALIEDDDVFRNVSVPLLFSKGKRKRIDSLVWEQLNLLGLDKIAHRKVYKLSGGEKQRVAIARALVNHPDVILADEPTGALDHANSGIIMDKMKELNSAGKTIIIVTHEDYVAESCNRIIHISDGRIIRDDIAKIG